MCSVQDHPCLIWFRSSRNVILSREGGEFTVSAKLPYHTWIEYDIQYRSVFRCAIAVLVSMTKFISFGAFKYSSKKNKLLFSWSGHNSQTHLCYIRGISSMIWKSWEHWTRGEIDAAALCILASMSDFCRTSDISAPAATRSLGLFTSYWYKEGLLCMLVWTNMT